MAEAPSIDDDVIVIPDTPSPVLGKKAKSTGFRGHHVPVNISPIKTNNSASAPSYSPPGEALSLPGQESFMNERAEAIRRKKEKDKFSGRLNDNGLSPIKRLSPCETSFVKSSSLLKSNAGSSPEKKPKISSSACASNSLKRDVSPNAFHSHLYERIKQKKEYSISKRPVTNASAGYGWPSDSDSSDDEILAGALDFLHKNSPETKTKSKNDKSKVMKTVGSSPRKKNNKGAVQLFQDSGDEFKQYMPPPAVRAKPKQNTSSRSATQTSSKNHIKSDTFLNNPHILSGEKTSPSKHTDIVLDQRFNGLAAKSEKYKTKHKLKHCGRCNIACDRQCGRDCDKQISPSLASLSAVCSNLTGQTGFRNDLKDSSATKTSNNSNITGLQMSKNNETEITLPARKRRLQTASRFSLVNLTGSGDSKNDTTGLQSSNNSSMASPPASRQERKRRLEILARGDIQNSDSSSEPVVVARSRQERKRMREEQSERWLTKMPKSSGNTKSKTPTKERISVSSEDATPETRNVINVVSQLEKDEEVARKLQEELDREFALQLQDQSGRSLSGSTDPYSEEEDDRYHSPFGNIGHHRVDSPVPRGRRQPRGSHGWHMYDPVTMARRRQREDIPAMELEQLLADAQNSFRAGLAQEMMMAGTQLSRRRRPRGGTGGGVLANLMFASPNASGNDYEALMDLGEMLGDAKQKGLSKHELQRLPTTAYKADENNPNAECHICMCDYEEGDSLKILPCFHSYHDKCIDMWIKQNATCPVCRVQIKLS